MPTYDYRCAECGHTLEVSQKISEDPLTLCPACERPALKRGIGGGSAIFRFQGSGFYITDYRRAKEEPSSCSKGKDSCSCC